MSKQFSSAMIFVFVMAIAFAMSRSSEQSLVGVGEVERSPNATQKEQILGAFIKDDSLRHTQKARGPIDVKLRVEGSAPANIGDVFVLRATIQTERDVNNVHFKWSIPDGVKLINGSQVGDISQLQVNSPAVLEMTLQKVSARNEQIHLHASVAENGMRSASVAQFNTDIQEILDTTDRTNKALAIKGALQGEPSTPKAHSVRIVQ